MRCPKCNYNNLDGSAVCNLCGELLHSVGRDYYTRFKESEKQSSQEAAPSPFKPKAATPSPSAGPGKVDYHLVCFPLNPVQLQPDQTYTIGRSGDNDIIFPVGQVSRRHARIEWSGDGFLIVDLQSHNGTFVNGEKTDRHNLRHGDQIKVGPYLLEFYTVAAGKAPPAGGRSMEATQDISLGADDTYEVGPFSGRLSEIELRDIARLLNMTRKTGKLEVKTPDYVGEVHFSDGEIVHALWKDLPSMNALAQILAQKEGSFRFIRVTEGLEKTLEGPTSKLLIEAMRMATRRS